MMSEKLTFGGRLRHAWNVFRNKDPSIETGYIPEGASYSTRPDRPYWRFSNAQAILAPIYNKISVSLASLTFMEVKVDENGQYKEKVSSSLTECLTIGANLDQSARAFKQECCMTLLEEGCIAIVPIDTDIDPVENGGYKINTLRVGIIKEWYPEDVRVNLYNEKTGFKEDVILPKKTIAIVENPFYAVMNESNTIIKTVMQDFNYLDKINRTLSSGKLNLIVQLPYSTKSPIKKKIADDHLRDIESQLDGNEHGIAYIDATEKVIQLNRSLENNLMEQLKFMLNVLYSQLGLTEAVVNGTADEQEMLNFYNQCIEPLAEAISLEMTRKFLTKTARTQGRSVKYFRNPFKLVPVEKLAEITDKLTRNEILSSNEVRSIIGYRPSEDPRANELRNKNLNVEEGYEPITVPTE